MKSRPVAIKINISNVLVTKNRCKYCGKIPVGYYVIRKHKNAAEPIRLKERMFWTSIYTDRMCSDFYLGFEPSHFTKANDFSFRLEKSVCPRLTKNKGQYSFNGYIYCKCGKTRWAINDDDRYYLSSNKPIKISPLSLNRKGKYYYPFKILYED